MTKMIPPVPTSAVMLPTPKQKIGFSIDSIVGNDAATNHNTTTNSTMTTTSANEQLCEKSNLNNNNNNNNKNNNNNNRSTQNGPTSPPQTPPGSAATMVTHILNSPTHQSHQQHQHQQQQQHHLSPLPPHLSLLTPNLHPHMPPHLTMAQQHALHQHLLLQHHQQQHQQQQQQQQQQRLEGIAPPMRQDIQEILQRLHNNAAAAAQLSSQNISNGPYSPPNAHQTRLTPDDTLPHMKRERSPLTVGMEHAQNPAQRHQPPHTPPKSVSPQSSQPPSPPALMLPGSPSSTATHTSTGLPQAQQQQSPSSSSHQQQQQYPKPMSGPILVPGMPPSGLVRPFPVGPGGPPPQPGPPQQGMPDIKALPPYINAPPELPPQHNPHLIAAAQFQMAAALQAGHVLGPAAAAAAAAGLPPHAAGFMPGPPGMPRDSYPLYPWLLSRHGRIFPHRFPGNFLLQPFRKPKRIRTAFSPSQLLKLEHAFESNQYVVGAERKALAQSLNLSETQVKVWFQNRRTKHKRMQQEDEKGGGGSSERNSQNASCDEDDDELIDMEMDDMDMECPSDDEHELDASH